MTKKYYAGIGSRKTPKHILERMMAIGYVLASDGFILRSGGADGADSAFEKGCDAAHGKKEIFLPWKGFNGSPSDFYEVSPEAIEIAAKFHPAWGKLNQGAKKLHSRNVYQVLGYDLNSPSFVVICYCDGTGGTMQALRIAIERNVPIINLFDKEKYSSFLNVFVDVKKYKEDII